jgi:archaellum component FlaC
MNYREKMREYLKEPNVFSSQYGKWGVLNKEQREYIRKLLDEMDRADEYIKNLYFKNENLQSKIDKANEILEENNRLEEFSEQLMEERNIYKNIVNELKELLRNPYNQDCIVQNNDFLNKIFELEKK